MSPKIRRLTATFEDPRVESLYVHDVFARTIQPFTRFSVIMTTLVFLSYGVHDLIVVPSIHVYAWTLRFGLFGPYALALVAFTYSRFYERFYGYAMLSLGLVTNAVVMLIGAAAAPGPGFFIYTGYAALFVVIGPFIGKMSVSMQTVYTLLTLFLFLLVELTLVHPAVEVLLSIAVTIVAMGGIGAVAAWQLEMQARDAFLQRQTIRDQLESLDIEKGKSDALLLNILPAKVADRLKQDGESIADGFARVTVLFSDIVGFTKMSDRLEPAEVVRRLNLIFSAFDAIADELHVEKIKTIGDAYMVAGGLPDRSENHASAIAEMALAMRESLDALSAQLGESVSIRIGIHTGPVVAGVIGRKKFIYDIWGDTVNTASRMESHALPGTIQITEDTAKELEATYVVTPRGEIEVKGKGLMKTFFLEGKRSEKNQPASS